MNRFLTLLVLFSLLLPRPAAAITLNSGFRGRVTINKVVTIAGPIDEDITASVSIQLAATKNLPGPRLVIIRSPGGSVSEGYKIIKLLQQEKARTHQKLVCAVIDGAHSMAFNILTTCDVRLATASATMVVHKVAIGGEGAPRLSAKNMRELAREMDRVDEPLNEANRKAMHLSRAEYDLNADAQRRWTAPELVRMHYLDAIVTLEP